MKKLYILLLTLIIPFGILAKGDINDSEPIETSEATIDYWDNLKIYPNPSVKYVNIENAKGAVLDVFNISGQKVFSRQLTRPRYVLDIGNWEQGAYYFRFRGKQGVKTQKVIVK